MNKIGAFISKYYKHPVAIGLYILILILIIYNWGKIKGSFKARKPPKDTDWGKDLTEAESQKVRGLSQRLFRDMDSWAVSSGFKDRDCDAYQELVNIPEKLLVAVYNDFNDLYYEKGDGTLYDWINDESFSLTAGCSNQLKETVLRKMEQYNLMSSEDSK